MTKEEWRGVLNYESVYQVSNHGRVRRIKDGSNTWSGRILKSHINSVGYPIISLCKEGKRQTKAVHRLVAESFLDQPTVNQEVNHKNGDKTDNHVSSLEWVTRAENVAHANNELGKTATHARGERQHLAKLTRFKVKEIRRLYATGDHTYRGLAAMFGVCATNIAKIVHHRTWRHVT